MTSRSGQILLALLVAGACACGAAPPATPALAPGAAPSSGAAPSEGQRCLDQANAKHEQKADEPPSIEVSHVLVRSAESKNAGEVTRSREQACLRALEAQQKLQGGAGFDEIVASYSDAPGAAAGALGSVKRDQLDPKFADAAFALDVNELSWVVESPAGFHVIVRTK